jgi:hypothetical protein
MLTRHLNSLNPRQFAKPQRRTIFVFGHRKDDESGIKSLVKESIRALKLSKNSSETLHLPFYKASDLTINVRYTGKYSRNNISISPLSICERGSQAVNIPIPCIQSKWAPCEGTHKIDIPSKMLSKRMYDSHGYHPAIVKLLLDENQDDVVNICNISNDFMKLSTKTDIKELMGRTEDSTKKHMDKLIISEVENHIRRSHCAAQVEITDFKYEIVGQPKLLTYYVPVILANYHKSDGSMEYFEITNRYTGKTSGKVGYDISELFIDNFVLGIIGLVGSMMCSIGFDKNLVLPVMGTYAVFALGNLSLAIAYNVRNGWKENPKDLYRNQFYSPALRPTRFFPSDQLQILGIDDDTKITEDILLEARDKRLEQLKELGYEDPENLGNAQKLISDTYVNLKRRLP